jgi:hypothetical protein
VTGATDEAWRACCQFLFLLGNSASMFFVTRWLTPDFYLRVFVYAGTFSGVVAHCNDAVELEPQEAFFGCLLSCLACSYWALAYTLNSVPRVDYRCVVDRPIISLICGWLARSSVGLSLFVGREFGRALWEAFSRRIARITACEPLAWSCPPGSAATSTGRILPNPRVPSRVAALNSSVAPRCGRSGWVGWRRSRSSTLRWAPCCAACTY